MIGEKFGDRTVIGYTEKENPPRIYWICKCKCGHIGPVRPDYLKRGLYTYCRRCSNNKRYDQSHLIGTVFGYLTVLEFVGTKKGERFFQCQCICGKKILTSIHRLTRGKKKRCARNCLEPDFLGRKFGNFTVIEFSHFDPAPRTGKNYKTQCICGHIQAVRKTDLLSGKAKRCRPCAMIKRSADNRVKYLKRKKR